ncbi:MAG: polysaccharide lyase family 7 protein [Bifidobacteriaceae bacterium]|nr:polysaccharide lyase family 7 protein [Bifidobacteriaceae bacterium]
MVLPVLFAALSHVGVDNAKSVPGSGQNGTAAASDWTKWGINTPEADAKGNSLWTCPLNTESQYYTFTEVGGIELTAPRSGGATTPNSSTLRTELREVEGGQGENACELRDYSAFTEGVYAHAQIALDITPVGNKVTIGQIHQKENTKPMLKIMVKPGTSGSAWRVEAEIRPSSGGTIEHQGLIALYELGQTLDLSWGVSRDGALSVLATNLATGEQGRVDARLEDSGEGSYRGERLFIKSGVYNNETGDGTSTATLYSLSTIRLPAGEPTEEPSNAPSEQPTPGPTERATDEPTEPAPTPMGESELTDDRRGGVNVPVSANPGQRIVVAVPGQVGSKARFWLHSTPVSLGSFALNQSGQVTLTIPQDAALGEHKIVVQALDGALVGWAWIRLEAPNSGQTAASPAAGAPVDSSAATAKGPLPVTGGGDWLPLFVGLAMTLVGLGVVAASSTRRRAARH